MRGRGDGEAAGGISSRTPRVTRVVALAARSRSDVRRHFREITISGDRVEGARFHAAVLGSPSGSLAGRVVARVQPPDGLPGLAGRRADGGGRGAGAGREGRGAGREGERTGTRTGRGRRRRGGQDRGRAGRRRFPGGGGRPASPREHAPVGDPGLGADRRCSCSASRSTSRPW